MSLNNLDAVKNDGTIKAEHMLLEVGATLVAFLEIRPVNAARFVTDWLAEWAQIGESQTSTVGQIDQDAFWRQMGSFLSRSVDYLTPEQQAWVVRQNLPSIVARDRFLRCIAALAEHVQNPKAVELLENAARSAHVLTSSELQTVLVDIIGPVNTSAW